MKNGWFGAKLNRRVGRDKAVAVPGISVQLAGNASLS